jgi:hypothetical protein
VGRSVGYERRLPRHFRAETSGDRRAGYGDAGGAAGSCSFWIWSRQYLPTCLSLLSILAQSPRTVGAFRDRVERAGPVRVRHHEAAKAFTCFGIAYLYKAVVKRSGQPELGVLLSRMATLVLLTPRELERVDLVTQTFSHRGPDGRRDRLAPANLLLWWLIGGESPAKAFEADTFLQLYADYLAHALDRALDYPSIRVPFPRTPPSRAGSLAISSMGSWRSRS